MHKNIKFVQVCIRKGNKLFFLWLDKFGNYYLGMPNVFLDKYTLQKENADKELQGISVDKDGTQYLQYVRSRRKVVCSGCKAIYEIND